MRLLLLLLCALPIPVQAADARLTRIHGLLLPMRAVRDGNLKARGATVAFTAIKHQLRDWIESRLPALQWNDPRHPPDPAVLQEQLNAELTDANLLCNSHTTPPCPYESELGWLAPIRIERRNASLLVILTGVGIQECGYDESAYAYEPSAGGWRPFWQSEQDEYEDGKYFPQRLREILISPGTERLILTLGVEPWCSSNWHDVYYRVWQAKEGFPEPALLVDGREWTYVDSVNGRVDQAGVWIEYAVPGVEGGFTRAELRHYVLQNGKLERTIPVALGPQDFTAYWLGRDWGEISRWSDEGNLSKLKEWQQGHRGPFAQFGKPTLHCKMEPDLWQVSTDMGEAVTEEVYFLIRWRPPYDFTMVSAGEAPRKECKDEDPAADERRSLFPR